jgi:hypothetical protein
MSLFLTIGIKRKIWKSSFKYFTIKRSKRSQNTGIGYNAFFISVFNNIAGLIKIKVGMSTQPTKGGLIDINFFNWPARGCKILPNTLKQLIGDTIYFC